MSEPVFSAKKKNRDNMLLLISHIPFQKKIKKLRPKLDIENPSDMSIEDENKWNCGLTLDKANLLAKTVRNIINDYHLPDNYDHYIRRHILCDTKYAPLNNFGIIPFSREMDPSASRHITVDIYARLTKKEWLDLKRELNRMAKNLPDFKPLKDIARKIENEKKIAERDELNKHRDKRERAFSLAEMNRRSVKKIYADKRELQDLRKKRFGK